MRNASIFKMGIRLGGLCMVAVLFAGCSTMDADECRTANWASLGYADSSKGKESAMSSKRAEACGKHGYRMDMQAYQRGWNEGLQEFCTVVGGQSFGGRGGNYQPGYCPRGAESDFMAGYFPAYKNYQNRQRIDRLQQSINSKNDEIIRLQGKKDSNNDSKISRLKGEVSSLYNELNMERMRQSSGR